MSITGKIKNIILPFTVVSGIAGFFYYKAIQPTREFYSRPIEIVEGRIVNESYDNGGIGTGSWERYQIVLETEDGRTVFGKVVDTYESKNLKARAYDNLYDPGDVVKISGRNDESEAKEFGVDLFLYLEDMTIIEE